MAVILPGAGDYESALRMMGEANAIDAFAEGRERNIRMQGELQRQALQRQAAEQREDEINRKQALESAGFTEEMLASALSGGGGATGGGGRRRASSAGPALDYEAASLQEALAADAAEAQAASTQRMRELDAAQMALAKQLPAQAALEREVDAGAARQRLLSGTPSYTASRMEQAELERAPLEEALRSIGRPISYKEAKFLEAGGSPEALKEGAPTEALKEDAPIDPLRLAIQRAGMSRGSEVDPASVGFPLAQAPTGMPKDEGTILVGSDLLKDVSEEDVLSAGGRKVTDAAGKTGYWLPAGGEIGLAKAGPVDDTAEGEGFRQGRLAFANKRLSEQTAKTNTLRSAVRRLKKKSGDQLVNPWERFGKPATFMPSIRATSFAVQRAKDGDPSLISQMIGRQLYPSELRDLESLTSNYQDFAGGVRAKATEITKSRKTAAQEAAEADELKEVTRFATLSRDLLKGANKGASEEYLDLASDEIALAWKNDPVTGRDFLNKHIAKNKSERDLFLKQEKARRDAENKGSVPGAGYYASFNSRQLEDKIGTWQQKVAAATESSRKAKAAFSKPMKVLNKNGVPADVSLEGRLVQNEDGAYTLAADASPVEKTAFKRLRNGVMAADDVLSFATDNLNRFTGERDRRLGIAPSSSPRAGDSKQPEDKSFSIGVDKARALKAQNTDRDSAKEQLLRKFPIETVSKILDEVYVGGGDASTSGEPVKVTPPTPTGARGGGPASSLGNEVLRKIGEAEKNKSSSRPSGPRPVQQSGESNKDFRERRDAAYKASGATVNSLKASAKKFAGDLADGGPEGMSDADKSAVAAAYQKAISRFDFGGPDDAAMSGPVDAKLKLIGRKITRAHNYPFNQEWLTEDEIGAMRKWLKRASG